MPTLEIKNLTVDYQGALALRGVSLEVSKGEVVAILGANGAGKSTLLRVISGLKKPSSGQVWYEGTRIDMAKPHEIVKRGLVQVSEGGRLFPYLSVRNNLMAGAYLRSSREVYETIAEVYSYFPVLKERSRQLANGLSGGERQMLATGRAMMARPKLLLLDEPSLGLSPIAVQLLGATISKIAQRGITMVLVEQNIGLAQSLASRGYMLEVGKISITGDIKRLVESDAVRRSYFGL